MLFPAPGAAFLRRESVQELLTCSAAGWAYPELAGQHLHHHQEGHAQMCKSPGQGDRRETGWTGRGDNHVFLCAALPLRGADAETSGRPARSVQPGMWAEAVQKRNVLTWAVPLVDGRGRWSARAISISFTPQLSLQYLLETAFLEQYQARFAALFNLNTSITMQLETLGRFTVIFLW